MGTTRRVHAGTGASSGHVAPMILSLQRVHDSQDLWLDGGEAFDLRELRAAMNLSFIRWPSISCL
jgi:hypothetical protein